MSMWLATTIPRMGLVFQPVSPFFRFKNWGMIGLRAMLSGIQKTFDEVAPHLESTLSRWSGGFNVGKKVIKTVEEFPAEYRPPSLSNVLSQNLPAPDRAVLLGVGADDGLYYLDLDNPVSGAILIVGDKVSNRTGLLCSMLDSATRLNNHHRVSISIICRSVAVFDPFVQTQHLQEILPLDDLVTSEFIREVAGEAVERSQGKRPEPAALLCIDDLAECLTFFDQEAYERLYWLIRHGPRYKIWTIATLQAEKIAYVDQRVLAAFRSWLVGRIADKNLAVQIAPAQVTELARLGPDQFYTPDRDKNRLFCTCKID